MKIQYCSDLHLEFPANKRYLKLNPIKPEGEILLLGGDIILFDEIEREKEFFDFVSDNFEHAYWIPGNHEYYRSDIAERTGEEGFLPARQIFVMEVMKGAIFPDLGEDPD